MCGGVRGGWVGAYGQGKDTCASKQWKEVDGKLDESAIRGSRKERWSPMGSGKR